MTKLGERSTRPVDSIIWPILQGFGSYARSVAEFRAGQRRLLKAL